MESFCVISQTLVPFLTVLTVLVFVHEWGHYLIARWNGVKIEVFSVGFGPEIFGVTDKRGTRWKLSLVPLGGYVRMLGDADASSRPSEELKNLSSQEKSQSLHFKHPSQRIAVSLAGPVANFLLAWVLLIGIFIFQGKPLYPPIASHILPGSAAEKAGIRSEDFLMSINGVPLGSFDDIQKRLLEEKGKPLHLQVKRGEEVLTLAPFYPDEKKVVDKLGREHVTSFLGVSREKVTYMQVSLWQAIKGATQEVYQVISMTLASLWEMLIGLRGAEGLGGPLRIAHMSGQMAQLGLAALCLYAAMLSISLGLINLFPIPMLDGGHVLFNLIEWVWGRPLPEKLQEYGYWIGFFIVASLMLFSTWNDLKFWRILELVQSYLK